MTQKLNEDFKVLEELLRKVKSYLDPMGYDDSLMWFCKKDLRFKFQGKNPKCFLSLNSKGRNIPFFPICNMTGAEDPKFIKFSLKLANAIKNHPLGDQLQIDAIITKLKRLDNKYSKDVPKPTDIASKKGQVTKSFNNIRNYLKDRLS